MVIMGMNPKLVDLILGCVSLAFFSISCQVEGKAKGSPFLLHFSILH